MLVDYTGRLFREGKAMISREVAAIFERVGTTAETWQARLQKLSVGRLLGPFSPSASHPAADLRSSTSRRAGSG